MTNCARWTLNVAMLSSSCIFNAPIGYRDRAKRPLLQVIPVVEFDKSILLSMGTSRALMAIEERGERFLCHEGNKPRVSALALAPGNLAMDKARAFAVMNDSRPKRLTPEKGEETNRSAKGTTGEKPDHDTLGNQTADGMPSGNQIAVG